MNFLKYKQTESLAKALTVRSKIKIFDSETKHLQFENKMVNLLSYRIKHFFKKGVQFEISFSTAKTPQKCSVLQGKSTF